MSTVYSIVGKADLWLPVIKDLLAEGGEWPATAVYCDAEQITAAEIEGNTEVQCFVQNSVRGVMIAPADGRHEVRLDTFASNADYAFAFRVMREAAQAGSTVSGGGGATKIAETLSEESAAAAQQEAWEFDLKAVREAVAKSDDDVAYLPVAGRQLPVGSADLRLAPADLEAELAERAERYLAAFPASVFTQQHETGEHVEISNYPGFPTLIPKSVQAISFQGEGGNLIEPWVPSTAFFLVVGGRLEDAGDCWYIPAIDLRAEPDLIGALQETAGHFDPKPGSETGAESPPDATRVAAQVPISSAAASGGGGGAFTPEESDSLRRASVIVLMLVAGTDNKVDKKELKVFASILSGTANLPPDADIPPGVDVLFLAFSLTASQLEATIAEVFNHPGGATHHLAELSRIGQLFDSKLTPEAANGAKMGLYDLGESIAEASGGFLGFGKKISKEEQAALDLVAAKLGIADI